MTDSITETVSPAGLRARATIQRGILDESCARHLELAAAEIERLRAALEWMENLDPQLIDAARERFRLVSLTSTDGKTP